MLSEVRGLTRLPKPEFCIKSTVGFPAKYAPEANASAEPSLGGMV
jgi:hypothetical protein